MYMHYVKILAIINVDSALKKIAFCKSVWYRISYFRVYQTVTDTNELISDSVLLINTNGKACFFCQL